MGLGLIQSFARPGGNITGVTDLDLELGPKRLELFQEILPGLKRVLFPYDASRCLCRGGGEEHTATPPAASASCWWSRPVRTQEEAQATLAQIQKGEVDGILMPRSLALNIPGFILEAAAQRAIPTMFDGAFWVERGGLASYGPDFHDSGRQAARLVDKILKGTKPAEIPVEVNPKIEFVINLKTAKPWG